MSKAAAAEIAKELFGAAAKGTAELVYGRPGMQGASELAHALFSGSAYGPAAREGSVHGQEAQKENANEGHGR